MNTVWLRKVEVGRGRPKVIVPIVESTARAILEKGRELKTVSMDIVEWRADFFEGVDDLQAVMDTLKGLREVLGETPILFTFRTRKEGGEREISPGDYTALNRVAARYADGVDVELFSGEDVVRESIAAIHAAGKAVIGSSHEFTHTPPKEEMVARLRRMQELGCDVLKIAVMPRIRRDVLELLAATEEVYSDYTCQPLITMSMGKLGVISRLCGQYFGSAATFGAAGQTSAPGQVPVERLNDALTLLEEFL